MWDYLKQGIVITVRAEQPKHTRFNASRAFRYAFHISYCSSLGSFLKCSCISERYTVWRTLSSVKWFMATTPLKNSLRNSRTALLLYIRFAVRQLAIGAFQEGGGRVGMGEEGLSVATCQMQVHSEFVSSVSRCRKSCFFDDSFLLKTRLLATELYVVVL